ncbi:hypothetical protein ACLSSQ_09370 [Azospira sp. APE16]|uniref:hypothetical protein n=1 Tax=Azospira sp. APE16 TaxID=3394231 RepID=UPI003A4DE321
MTQLMYVATIIAGFAAVAFAGFLVYEVSAFKKRKGAQKEQAALELAALKAGVDEVLAVDIKSVMAKNDFAAEGILVARIAPEQKAKQAAADSKKQRDKQLERELRYGKKKAA